MDNWELVYFYSYYYFFVLRTIIQGAFKLINIPNTAVFGPTIVCLLFYLKKPGNCSVFGPTIVCLLNLKKPGNCSKFCFVFHDVAISSFVQYQFQITKM